MTKLRFAIPIAMLMSTGCLRSTAFHCTSDTQCSSGGPAGKCQTSVGFCSFADPGCPDGQRFGDLADMYANTCVGVIPLIDAGIDAHLIDARLADAQLVSVGGTVTGLTGTGLVLKNNNADPLSVISSGMFTFGMKLAIGSPYSVTIVSPPSGQDGRSRQHAAREVRAGVVELAADRPHSRHSQAKLPGLHPTIARARPSRIMRAVTKTNGQSGFA